MSIRHAILGLLAEQPMHGYRLKEVFDARVSPLWGLTTGQIYQSLAALERTALVESRGERKGRRPARRVYTVTAAGRGELASWLRRKPEAWMRPFREEILIRLMMLREAEAPELRRSLERREREATDLLTRITRMRHARHATSGTIDLTRIFLEDMTHHLEADIRTLQTFRGEIEAWANEHDAEIGHPCDVPSAT